MDETRSRIKTRTKHFLEVVWSHCAAALQKLRPQPAIWSVITLILASGTFAFTRDPSPAILLATAILIAWYSWETFLLRTEMRRQNDSREMPIIDLYLQEQKQGQPSGWFVVKNISAEPAYNVAVEPIDLDSLSYRFHFGHANSILEPHGGEHALQMVTLIPHGITAYTIENFKSHFTAASFSRFEEVKEKFAIFLIHYKNLSGKQFHTVFKFTTKSPVTSEFTIEFITSGTGALAKETAMALAAQQPKQPSVYR